MKHISLLRGRCGDCVPCWKVLQSLRGYTHMYTRCIYTGWHWLYTHVCKYFVLNGLTLLSLWTFRRVGWGNSVGTALVNWTRLLAIVHDRWFPIYITGWRGCGSRCLSGWWCGGGDVRNEANDQGKAEKLRGRRIRYLEFMHRALKQTIFRGSWSWSPKKSFESDLESVSGSGSNFGSSSSTSSPSVTFPRIPPVP